MTAWSQGKIQGNWLVCDIGEKCESEGAPYLFMVIGDTKLALVMSQTTDSKPAVAGRNEYHVNGDSLIVMDTDKSGRPVRSAYLVHWYDEDHIKITSIGDNVVLHLFREEI